MPLTDVRVPVPPPPPPAARSRVREVLDRIPTLVYLAVLALMLVGIVALFGGLQDGHKTYARAEAGSPVDVGIAEIAIDSVRLHPTDFYDDQADGGVEFLTIRMTVTNTSESTYPVSGLVTTGTFADPVYGIKPVSIDEDIALDYPSIRTAAGESSVQIGPHLTQTYDVTFEVLEPLADRQLLSLVFAPSQYTPNKFLRDKSEGYYETLETTALGEFAITDESGAP